jgi:hypothetical protein
MKTPKNCSTYLKEAIRLMNGCRHTQEEVRFLHSSHRSLFKLNLLLAARVNATDDIDAIPDMDGPSESPKMPTKQLGGLTLDADTSISNIPDMDEIPDMEEEDLEGEEDAATAAPAKPVAVYVSSHFVLSQTSLKLVQCGYDSR